jgi:hypothetical protein
MSNLKSDHMIESHERRDMEQDDGEETDLQDSPFPLQTAGYAARMD